MRQSQGTGPVAKTLDHSIEYGGDLSSDKSARPPHLTVMRPESRQFSANAVKDGLPIDTNKSAVIHSHYPFPQPLRLNNGDVIPVTDSYKLLGVVMGQRGSVPLRIKASVHSAARPFSSTTPGPGARP
jgi:hypothetical protein